MHLITTVLLCLTIFSLVVSVLSFGLPDPQPTPKVKPLKHTNKPARVKSVKARERVDKSINDYIAERTCWWNEMCKEEFSTKFRCRCPLWSYCSSPGRYYNAYCTMTGTGYLWSQQPKGPGIGALYRPPSKSRL